METPNQAALEDPLEYEKFPLKADLLKGIKDYGCLDPFTAKEDVLLPILEGRDLYAESQTSLAKMLAYMIAALQLIKPDKKDCQVLILMPVRELSLQAVELAKQIGKHMQDLNVLAIYGGIGIREMQAKLREGPSIVISTPGRLFDVVDRGILELKWLKLLILDEADELFGRGFKDQILGTLKLVPTDVQMAIISATKCDEIQNMIDLCLRDPVCVKREDVYMDMKETTHYKVSVENKEEKIDFLVKYYQKTEERRSIIFCQKVEDLEKLVEALKQEKFAVEKMDYSMSAGDRWKAIEEFLRGRAEILITVDYVFFEEMKCTQSNTRLIINYDVPARKQNYQKNFGIMKRFSRRQTAINLVMPAETLNLKEIEMFYGVNFFELTPDIVII